MNKVLIIDDDKELCALIKRSVLSEDIEADFCNMGKEGLQKLKEREYQLVILDVMMPGMDGFETLEEIRKENSLPILMFRHDNRRADPHTALPSSTSETLRSDFLRSPRSCGRDTTAWWSPAKYRHFVRKWIF